MSDPFDSISGLDLVKEKLKRLVDSNRVPQALLFTGSEIGQKKECAFCFAQKILGTHKNEHPDIHVYVPEGKVGLHSISSMRQFSDDVYMAPFEAQKKVFIILEADRMLSASANALLKTFEEPALDTVIILVSSHPSSMLPTILSRCQKIKIDHQSVRVQDKDPLYTLIMRGVASGALTSYAKILELVDQLSIHLDEEFKELEKNLQDTQIKGRSNQLTALQKESLIKEIDGTVALQKKVRIKELFIAFQSWYRDLHLLRIKGDPRLLMNPGFEKELSKAISNREIPSLSRVEQAVRDALLSLERSTSPKICFENLFLRLI